MAKDKSKDYQERRSGKERRQYEFTLHIPENRSGKDRRKKDKSKNPKKMDKSSTCQKGNQEKARNKKD